MNDGLGGDFRAEPERTSSPGRKVTTSPPELWNILIASQIGTMDLEAATSGARADIPSRVQGHYLVAGTYGHPKR